jgi:hypothetical protein
VLRDYFVNMHALMSKPLEDFRGDNISH